MVEELVIVNITFNEMIKKLKILIPNVSIGQNLLQVNKQKKKKKPVASLVYNLVYIKQGLYFVI